jgi:hypothetical protein
MTPMTLGECHISFMECNIAIVERSDKIYLDGIQPEMLQKIFSYIKDLNRLFTVSQKVYGAAYKTLEKRLVLEWNNPFREIYIQMISFREFANDWQLRIRKAAIHSQIMSRRDRTEEHREQWLLYNEDDEIEVDWYADD